MSTTKFNPNVHGARGLFALALFFFHIVNSKLAAPDLPFYRYVEQALMSFEFGVELFFVISGIVIYGAFQRSSSLGQFFFNRATRIWPLLWVTMSVMFLMTLFGTDRMLGEPWSMLAGYFVGNMLALPPMVSMPIFHPAAWSLSYEFAFYGLMILFGLTAKHVPRGVAMAIVALVGVVVYWHHIRAIYFVAGLLIGSGVFHSESNAIVRLSRYPAVWMVVFLFVWKSVAEMVGGNIHAAIFARLFAEPPLIPLVGLAFFCALVTMVGVAKGYGHLSRLLRTSLFQWLGTISFSLYLWQAPVMAVVKKLMYVTHIVERVGGLAQPVFLLLALPPVLLVSHYSQVWIEGHLTTKLRLLAFRKKPVIGTPA